MTESVQKFLLNNTKFLQKLVNEKLANGKLFPNLFKWMEIGPRGYGKHIFPKYFKTWNSFILIFGHRFNWARPHITKALFSKEREVFLTGYAVLFILFSFWARKNMIKPGDINRDTHLYHYDNPNHLVEKFGKFIPNHYTQFKVSAHYLEIDKIFRREMMKRFTEYEEEVAREFENSSEKDRRTKYLANPNYVYEPFGWESEQK
mmetsp:Transcript_13882/g.14421  ORF Transcript_13882/g.14421 Transcript_13882/m.14421 type:complete len:204 (+) Transcript_13882:3-614(+)